MDDGVAVPGWAPTQQSRFELTAPRHFLLPAVLLLLSEEPGHGYDLAGRLKALRFGRVDRPSVYRALAQLERDGLVASSPDAPRAGQERRTYALTDQGERALRAWMGVIKEERDRLDNVLRRYIATGTLDATLAEVEGGWASVTGPSWSAVSSSSPADGRHAARPSGARSVRAAATFPIVPTEVGRARDTPTTRYRLVPDRSVPLVEARSSVGPITFGVIGVSGTLEADVRDGTLCLDQPPSAHLEIRVDGLRSGNPLHDAELLRRIDARRYPVVSLALEGCAPTGSRHRFRLGGEIVFHGVSRPMEGTVSVESGPDGRLVVHGEQVLDIRDFGIASPTVLMLRIYPDVKVQLQIEAEAEG